MKIYSIYLQIFFTLFAANLFSEPSALADEPIKIGALYTLTGDMSQYGEWHRRGSDLAVEQINNQNGVRGRKLQIVYEDPEGQPSKAVSGYQKLRNSDRVSYISTSMSSLALAVKPLAEHDKVVQMDISSTAPKYDSRNGWSFRTSISATKLAYEEAQQIYNKFGIGEVGFVYIQNDFGLGMYQVFKDSFAGAIPIVETFNPNERDFRSQLIRIKSSHLKNIVIVSMG